METLHEHHNEFLNSDHNLKNIISINNHADVEIDECDFDFDYDPNDMYYELNGGRH